MLTYSQQQLCLQMKTKPQTRHRHAELFGSPGPIRFPLAVFPPLFSSYDFVHWPKLFSRITGGEHLDGVCVCLIDTHTYAVMSQAL